MPPRQRSSKTSTARKKIIDSLPNRGLKTLAGKFPVQEFRSFDEMENYMVTEYQPKYFTCFRKRTTIARALTNKKLYVSTFFGMYMFSYSFYVFSISEKGQLTRPVLQLLGGDPIPESVGKYLNVNYRCTHGVFQQSRSEGSRAHHFVRFTGCDARFVAEVARTSAGDWKVVIRNEVKVFIIVLLYIYPTLTFK